MTTLVPGTVLQDRYQIVGPCGQGGMGAVYEAVQGRLKRRVAVKQLLIVGEARRSRAFLREAQILANLEHRALPDIIDYFTDDAGHFLVMDFVPGDDLAMQLAQRRAPFPLDKVMQWADEVLDVLDYLHTQHAEPIYHGDIKPHNLKLRPTGEIMVLDFGLAKGYLAEMTHVAGESSIVGYTPGYSPPEQVEGSGTDGRSDLYALGATLHRLLTNTPPVDEGSRWRAVARGWRDPLRPVHELNPEVPEAVSQVLEEALQLEPDARPPSAVAMRAALRAAYRSADPGSAAMPATIMPPPVDEADPALVDASPFLVSADHTAVGEYAPQDSQPAIDEDAPQDVQSPIDEDVPQDSQSAVDEHAPQDVQSVVDRSPVEAAPTEVSPRMIAPLDDVPTPIPKPRPADTPFPQPTEATDVTVHAAVDEPPIDSVPSAAAPAAQPTDAAVTAMPALTLAPLVTRPSTTLDAASEIPQPAEAEPTVVAASQAPQSVEPELVDASQVPQPAEAEPTVTAASDVPQPAEAEPTVVGARAQALPLDDTMLTVQSPQHDHPSDEYGLTESNAPSANTYVTELAPLPNAISLGYASVAIDTPDVTLAQANEAAEPPVLPVGVEAKPRKKQARYWAVIGIAVLLVPLVIFVLRSLSTSAAGIDPTTLPTAVADATPALPSSGGQIAVESAPASPSSGGQVVELATPAPILPTPTAITISCDGGQTAVDETGNAEDHLKNGLAALAASNYDEAIGEYSRALELDPRSTEAYISRGQAFHMQKKYDCSIDDYNQALELDPQSVVAYNFRGNAYANQQDDRPIKDYSLAINDYTKAIELSQQQNLRYAAPFLNRALAHYAGQEYDQAVDDYTLALEQEPDDVKKKVIYHGRGQAYYASETYDQAISDYDQAIARDQNYAEAYFDRGLAYKLKGSGEEINQAISDFNNVLEISNDPDLRQKAENELRALSAPPDATATY